MNSLSGSNGFDDWTRRYGKSLLDSEGETVGVWCDSDGEKSVWVRG